MGENLNRAAFIALVAGLAIAVGVGAGLMRRPPPPTTEVLRGPEVSAVSSIDVHVAGWVASPGVVSVPQGSIVAEAVEAAGGMRPGAQTQAINLAAEVLAGDQIVVPGPEAVTDVGGDVDSGGLISLNRADVAELEGLPGVGPVLAERIVSYRDENGRFESVDDLLDVAGIGEAKLASIRDLIKP